jgi:hypothetical protein
MEEKMKVPYFALPLLLFLASCASGGGSVGANSSLPASIAGKWTINSTSTEGHLNSLLEADLVDQGNGSFNASQVVLCYSDPTFTCYGSYFGNGSIAIQGTVTGQGTVSMMVTSSPQGATGCSTTYTGALVGNSMTATYTGCQDAGTMAATTNPSVTGTYKGQLTSTSNPGLLPVGISASITEASDHSLSGAASVTSSPCFTSLTFGPPSIAVGGTVYLEDVTHAVIVLSAVGSAANFSTINVAYIVSPSLFCTADSGTGTMTKQ